MCEVQNAFMGVKQLLANGLSVPEAVEREAKRYSLFAEDKELLEEMVREWLISRWQVNIRFRCECCDTSTFYITLRSRGAGSDIQGSLFYMCYLCHAQYNLRWSYESGLEVEVVSRPHNDGYAGNVFSYEFETRFREGTGLKGSIAYAYETVRTLCPEHNRRLTLTLSKIARRILEGEYHMDVYCPHCSYRNVLTIVKELRRGENVTFCTHCGGGFKVLLAPGWVLEAVEAIGELRAPTFLLDGKRFEVLDWDFILESLNIADGDDDEDYYCADDEYEEDYDSEERRRRRRRHEEENTEEEG